MSKLASEFLGKIDVARPPTADSPQKLFRLTRSAGKMPALRLTWNLSLDFSDRRIGEIRSSVSVKDS